MRALRLSIVVAFGLLGLNTSFAQPSVVAEEEKLVLACQDEVEKLDQAFDPSKFVQAYDQYKLMLDMLTQGPDSPDIIAQNVEKIICDTTQPLLYRVLAMDTLLNLRSIMSVLSNEVLISGWNNEITQSKGLVEKIGEEIKGDLSCSIIHTFSINVSIPNSDVTSESLRIYCREVEI